jgi:hypothetical protein
MQPFALQVSRGDSVVTLTKIAIKTIQNGLVNLWLLTDYQMPLSQVTNQHPSNQHNARMNCRLRIKVDILPGQSP